MSTNEPTPSATPYKVPAFFYVFLSLVFGYYAGVKIALLSLFLYYILRRYGVFLSIKDSWKEYRSRASEHGPTMGEKIYYYVDYWLSTNP